jgi:hypothetical protein
MTHGRYSIGGGLIFVMIISAVLKSLFSWSGKLAFGLGRFLLTGTGLLRTLSYDSWVTLIGIFHAAIKHNVNMKKIFIVNKYIEISFNKYYNADYYPLSEVPDYNQL